MCFGRYYRTSFVDIDGTEYLLWHISIRSRWLITGTLFLWLMSSEKDPEFVYSGSGRGLGLSDFVYDHGSSIGGIGNKVCTPSGTINRNLRRSELRI